MLTPPRLTFLISALSLLPCAAPLLAQQPAPPAPKAPEPLTPPAPTRARVLAENGELMVSTMVTSELLSQVMRRSPELIPPVIEAVKKQIDAQTPNERPRAYLRLVLCQQLLESAPVYGISEFEAIEAAPGPMKGPPLGTLRLYAGCAYIGEHRLEPGQRQFRLAAEDEENGDEIRAHAYLLLASVVDQTQLDECLQCLAKADTLFSRVGETPIMLLVFHLVLGHDAKVEQLIDTKPDLDEERAWAIGIARGAAHLKTMATLTPAQARAYVETALARLDQDNASPSQRFGDLITFTAAVRLAFPEIALLAATRAEALAKDHPNNAEGLAIARLSRAKMLKALGRTRDLAGYSDVDLAETVEGGWTLIANQISSKARRKKPEN